MGNQQQVREGQANIELYWKLSVQTEDLEVFFKKKNLPNSKANGILMGF